MSWFSEVKVGQTIVINGVRLSFDRRVTICVRDRAEITLIKGDGEELKPKPSED